jgi:hypothetical protein
MRRVLQRAEPSLVGGVGWRPYNGAVGGHQLPVHLTGHFYFRRKLYIYKARKTVSSKVPTEVKTEVKFLVKTEVYI